MPAKNKRVSVTLTESQFSVVSRLARVNKQSMSSIIGELVETSEPVLRRVADLCEFAEKAREEQRDVMKASLEEAAGEIEPLLLRALRLLGIESREVPSAGVPGVRQRGPGEGPGGGG